MKSTQTIGYSTDSSTIIGIKHKIDTTKQQIVELEKEIVKERINKAKDLPNYLLVTNMAEAISVLRAANVINAPIVQRKSKLHYISKQGKKIPGEIRNQVEKLAKQSYLTGSEIAAKVGISLPSVQNIKKRLGLVREYHHSY